MNLHPLDLTVLLLYFTAVIGMGFYFARKNNSTEEYFLGGRRFSGWAIGLSMMGTAISSITFLAMPADAFRTTWIRFLVYSALPVGVIVAAIWIVPIFRHGKITSAYEYLENRFGPSIRVYGSLSYILAQILRISMILYLLALLMQSITGIDLITCVVLTGIFVGLYTVVGGIDAVIWTDVFQTIILAAGSIIGLGIIVNALPGGFGQVIEVGIAHDKLSFGALVNGELIPASWAFSLSEKTATMLFIVGISFFLTEYLSGQHMIQRYCAARSTREARKGLMVNLFVAMPVWVFYMLFGTALYVFFTVFPATEMTEILEGSRRAEELVPYFILNHLPAGLSGLLLAAALAAGMSSLDSSINAVSTVSVVDIYKRHIAKGKADAHYLLVAKLVTALVTALMIVGAIALITANTRTLQDTSVTLTSLVTGGILGLFVLGLTTTRGSARSVWMGIFFTLLFTLWTILQKNRVLPESLSVPFDLYYTGVIGNFVMFIVGYCTGLIFDRIEPPSKDLTGLTVWTTQDQEQ